MCWTPRVSLQWEATGWSQMVGRGQRSNHPACRTLLAAALVGRADLLLAAAPVGRADLKDGGWDKAQPSARNWWQKVCSYPLVPENTHWPTGVRKCTARRKWTAVHMSDNCFWKQPQTPEKLSSNKDSRWRINEKQEVSALGYSRGIPISCRQWIFPKLLNTTEKVT